MHRKTTFRRLKSGLCPAASLLALIVSLAAPTAKAALDAEDETSPTREAYAKILGCSGADINGWAYLEERKSAEGVKVVDIRLRVRGLADGKHGIHIHEVANCQPCAEAKGHFDPGPNGNSNPDGNHPFHSGDLVNLEVKGGFGFLRTKTTRVSLSQGPLTILDNDGSAFIIHTNPDTYCPNGAEAGCAGGTRIACGVIQSER